MRKISLCDFPSNYKQLCVCIRTRLRTDSVCVPILVCVDSLLEGHIMMANHEAKRNTVLLKTFKT